MKYLLLLVLIATCLATGCHGFKVEGRVRGCQGPDNHNVMAEVVLEGGLYRGFPELTTSSPFITFKRVLTSPL